MNIVILGSGGREHALCYYIKQSPKVKNIYCIPGNAGTSKIAVNIDIDIDNFSLLKEFIIKNTIDIVIVGPEKPLVNGVTDYLEKNRIKVFGPSKKASQLEGSKIFTKKLCKKYNIPTAKFGILKNLKETDSYINNCKFPIVVKADGLASGKGVYICKTKKVAKIAARQIFNGKFGNAKKILIEEFLKGEEMSFFIISDGKNFKKFGTAQDHKRAKEGDLGLNTGGMGAYSPSRLESTKLDNKIINKIIKPTLKALKNIGTNFKGFLYVGLMIVKNEPYLIEYNVRMGDPECQTILPKLKTDFFDIILASVTKNLKSINIEWDNKKNLCVVLCAKGYPATFKKNIEIKNINSIKLKKNEYIFHAGTKYNQLKTFSNGGRVLNFVVGSNSFKKSRTIANNIIKKLNWTGGYFRKDIGYKVINK
jgi:phosphoribosylamine--glycine ligase